MRSAERQAEILRCLEARGALSVEEAVRLYGASPATIRRDFGALARARVAERTHGGVKRTERTEGENLPFGLREIQYSAEKAALARHAASLVEAGDVIMVDGGTSTFHLCQYLPPFKLQIITNSLRLAAGLDEGRPGRSAWEVLLVGGNLYPDSGLLIGPQACANLEQYHARFAFLSAGGVCEDGIYNTNEFVAACERIMVRNAENVVLLADHSKIGKKAMCRVCGIEEIGRLVTDAHVESRDAAGRLRELGMRVDEVGLAEEERGGIIG